jgi:pyocin large subunit-like protein
VGSLNPISALVPTGPYAALRVVRECSTAAGPARSVLTILATYADDTGLAWPSLPTLCRDTGLSRSTVQRATQDLVTAGELLIVELGSGRGRSTRYRIPLSTLVHKAVDNSPDGPIKGVTLTPFPKRNSVTEADKGCHPDTRTTKEQPRGDARATVDAACPVHNGMTDPPPCRRCKVAREAVEAADAARRKADTLARRRADRDRADREAAARADRAASADLHAIDDAKRLARAATREALATTRHNTSRPGTLPATKGTTHADRLRR